MQNEYLDAVVQETLRLGANFLLLTRYAAVNTKIGDIPIDKGTEIRLLTHAGHNAFDRWNDARTFKPERFLKNADANQDNFFIPFGLGPKQCLGRIRRPFCSRPKILALPSFLKKKCL